MRLDNARGLITMGASAFFRMWSDGPCALAPGIAARTAAYDTDPCLAFNVRG